jgi:hypothetical protein
MEWRPVVRPSVDNAAGSGDPRRTSRGKSGATRLLGLDGPVIPDPISLDRIVAADPEPKYVTFINPQPSKGMGVFARIAVVLNKRRPDIPLLLVEGRGTFDALARLPTECGRPTDKPPSSHWRRRFSTEQRCPVFPSPSCRRPI